MKPHLVIGLGNPLAGDDAIACQIVRQLHDHPRLPGTFELLEGGTDLLRLEGHLEGRDRLILLDALLEEGPPGRLLRFEGDLHELDDHTGSVHHLSPVQALRLLRCLYPTLQRTPVTYLGITIAGVAISQRLSPALDARLPGLVREVLDILAEIGSEAPAAPRLV